MNVSDIPRILDEAYRHRREVVPCFIGPPGIGKTQVVKGWCEKNGRRCVEMLGKQLQPNEVTGIMMPYEKDDVYEARYYDSAILSSLQDGDVLFLDELLQSPPAVLSAMLKLLMDRRMASGTPLADVFIVAAANPLASPSHVAFEVRQRFMFFIVDKENSTWIKWMKDSRGINVSNLISYIESKDRDVFNILTPRTLTKLIDMCIESYDERHHVCHSSFAENILPGISAKVGNMLNVKDKEVKDDDGLYELLINILVNEFEMDKKWLRSISKYRLLDQIKDKTSTSEWFRIQAYLSTVEIDLEDCSVPNHYIYDIL